MTPTNQIGVDYGNGSMVTTADVKPKIYCMSCRSRQDANGVHVHKMKNGKPMLKGICVACGSKVNKIVGDVEANKYAVQ